MKKLKESDSPEYRIFNQGTLSVSDPELLSVITGRDLPSMRKVTTEYHISDLAKMSYHDMLDMGMPPASAMRLVASFELVRRKIETIRPVINSSKDAYEQFTPVLSELAHEEMYALFLNRANKVIYRWKVSQGGISGTVTDVRMILKKAIQLSASSIILGHNHPSGNIKPSQADLTITKKLKESAEIMDIKLLDYIIVGETNYYSFADEGQV